MDDIPEKDLAETRAALAPTLEATAAILPWVARPQAPRFPKKLTERWTQTSARIGTAWTERATSGLQLLRPAIFELYNVALELQDPDSLRLAEALASATDRLEDERALADSRLAATITAAVEFLTDKEGIEHAAFPERARHFAGRLEGCATAHLGTKVRSATLDHLFVHEAMEWIGHIREALDMLPPDTYAIKEAAEAIKNLAEPLEFWGIIHLAGELYDLVTPRCGEHVDLDAPLVRDLVLACVRQLEKSLAQIES